MKKLNFRLCSIPNLSVDEYFGGHYWANAALTVYAQNGFDDLNITGNSSYRVGTMYCTEDYSQNCSINPGEGTDEWMCDLNGTSTCNNGIITTASPTFQPTPNPTIAIPISIIDEKTTEVKEGEISTSSDYRVDDIMESTQTTESTNEPITDNSSDMDKGTTLSSHIGYIIYAVIGLCAVCSLVFAMLMGKRSKRKSGQIAQANDVADLEGHPSLNPDSSKFVPGKVRSNVKPKIEPIDVNESPESNHTEIEMQESEKTPSSSEIVIPNKSPSIIAGIATGDDI